MTPLDPCGPVIAGLSTATVQSGRVSTRFIRDAVPVNMTAKEMGTYAILDQARTGISNAWYGIERNLSPGRADTMLNILMKHATSMGKSILAADFRTTKLKADLTLQLMFSSFVHTDGVYQTAKNAGFKPGSTLEHTIGAAANFIPVNRFLLEMGNLKGKKLVDATRRLLTDASAWDEGFKFANGADIYSFGATNFSPMRDKMISILGSTKHVTDDHLLLFADAYREQSAQYLRSRAAAIKVWRNYNPGIANRMTDDAVAIEAGIGPTLHSYKTHILSNFVRTGERDEVIEMFLKSGTINLEGGVNELSDAFRNILGASPTTPFVNAKNISFTSPLAAMRSALPAYANDEAYLNVVLSKIKHLPASANDDTFISTLIPSFKNRHLLKREGAQGFAPGFFDTYRAVMRHGLRQEHLDPLMHPGGEVHDLIRKLQKADNVSAVVVAEHFRSIMGIKDSGTWTGDYNKSMSGLTKLVYNSLARLRPGMAVPNILTIPTMLWPELIGKHGLIEGSIHFMTGAVMQFSPRFKALYRTTGLGTDYLHSFSAETYNKSQERIKLALSAGDGKAVRQSMLDLTIPFTDLLSLSESHIVRPWAAASALSAYISKAGNRFDNEAARLAMIESVEAVTTLGLSTNSLPIVRTVRNALGPVGPIATMFSATPLNIAGQMLHEADMIVSGPAHQRLAASRSLLGKVFMGTLVAGPYWIWPWLREAEKLPGFSYERTERFLSVLDSIEQRYSLSGWLGMDLSRRISPTAGVLDVTTRAGAPIPDNSVEYAMRMLLGPAASPVNDIFSALLGDDNAQRRALGALAPMVAGLPPSQTLPSAVVSFTPAGYFFESMARFGLTELTDPRGYVKMGPLGFPVRTSAGFAVDSKGRPLLATDEVSELRRYLLGGRTLSSAQTSALGNRAEKKAAARQEVESQLRAAILSGNSSRAYDIYNSNIDLNPTVDLSSLKREQLSRLLPPQARAVYFGRPEDAIDRAKIAAARIQDGGLSESVVAHEKAILFAAWLKISRMQ